MNGINGLIVDMNVYTAALACHAFADITGGHNAMRTDQPGYREAVRTFIRENKFGE